MDTHVHTCLSPCAELEMHPAALVEAAVAAGLDTVAVCDHNSTENVPAVERAGRRAGLAVIPGMEVTTAEEVHVVGLLPHVEAAMELQSRVYAALPGRNDERAFGMQVIANEHAEVLGFNEHLLAGATTLSVDEVVAAIHRVRGLAVAAHVDREGFGIIGQLGMIPPGLGLDALEVSRRTTHAEACRAYPQFAVLCASDAHEPKDIGAAATFAWMAEPTLSELRKALAEQDGRMILGGGRLMEDLALHILDIAQNSVEAGATSIEIDLLEDPERDRLLIEVRDDGPGMDGERVARAADPFFTSRTTRRVGMGLSLLAEAARAAEGDFKIDSAPGAGTRVRATFRHSHIDRAPLGDVETTMMVLMAGQPQVDVRFRHCVGDRIFELDSRDLRPAGESGVIFPELLSALREYIRQGEAELRKASNVRG
jgi:3',5'-nucleoside bisphosphate phosphatase